VTHVGTLPYAQLANLPAAVTPLKIEGLTVRGRYRVLLRQVTDAVGCTSDQHSERTVVVDRVTATLACHEGPGGTPMRAGEGSKLSVSLAGGVPPYYVEYRTPASPVPVQSEPVNRQLYGIPLTVSGTYGVVSVRDGYCNGVVERPDSCAVDVVARPTVQVQPLATQGAIRDS